MQNITRLTNNTSVDLTVKRTASGGFGVVYMGPNHLDNDRWYALKTYQQRMPPSTWQLTRDRFVREAITLLGIWPHVNLLGGIIVLLINGKPYILMQYAEGGNLRSQLQLSHRISTKLRWAQMITSGLLALHTPDPEFLRPYPLVHRDLKPENILLDGNRVAKISDFGLARAFENGSLDDVDIGADSSTGTASVARHSRRLRTERGVVIGTPAYMAPEQWINANLIATPVDIYAFGVILSELFANRHPLHGLAPLPWPLLHASQTPRPLREVAPELPIEVERLYYSCLEKQPENRPTAAEALAVLQRASEALGEPRYVAQPLERTPAHEGQMWNRWAKAYYRFAFTQEGFERSQRALALLPETSNILLTHAYLLRSMKRYDEAIAYAEHGIRVAQSNRIRAECLNVQAVSLRSLGRYPEADIIFARSLALVSNEDEWCSRGTLHIFWARKLCDVGQPLEAHHHLQLAENYIGHAVYLNKDYIYHARLYEAVQVELQEWGREEPWRYCHCYRAEDGSLVLSIKYNKNGLVKQESSQSSH